MCDPGGMAATAQTPTLPSITHIRTCLKGASMFYLNNSTQGYDIFSGLAYLQLHIHLQTRLGTRLLKKQVHGLMLSYCLSQSHWQVEIATPMQFPYQTSPYAEHRFDSTAITGSYAMFALCPAYSRIVEMGYIRVDQPMLRSMQPSS